MTAADAALIFKSAHELTGLLSTGQTTSVHLVTAFLDQIERHEKRGKKLNALISVAPREDVLRRAGELDAERKKGAVRSVLHGMPIVLKDTYVTGPELGMPTSAGAAFFAGLTAKQNGTIVQRLLDAGLIIIGKGNMTEYCGMKSNDTPVGWSAQGGLTLSAYRRDDLDEKDQPTSAGSSNGPTVSISAGFAPLALGTETSGSVVVPASVNGVYGIKLSFDSVPLDGVCKLSRSFDHVGVFARDPLDLVSLIGILSAKTEGFGELEEGFEGLSVGVLRSDWGVSEEVANEKWNTTDVKERYDGAVKKLRGLGSRVLDVEVEKPDDVLKYNGETLVSVAYYEFQSSIAEFITCFEPVPGITTLKDVIAWNEQHPDLALPKPYTTQTELIAAAESTMTEETRAEAAQDLYRIATTGSIGKEVYDQNLDIILSNSDATLVHYASCAGWPIAAVPLGRLSKNGQPYGMFAMARWGREDVLLRFMRAWDGEFGRCEGPDMR